MSEKNNKKSEARTNLEIEWERLKPLIPHVSSGKGKVQDVELGIYDLLDGKKNCEEVVKAQDLSTDTAVLIFLRLERDGLIRCIEPSEKLRDVKFEKCEAGKELGFVKMEGDRLQEKITRINGELLHVQTQNRGFMETISSLNNKIGLITKNIERLSQKHGDASDSVDRLVGNRMDMLKQKKQIDKTAAFMKEEVIFLKDEKWSAMKSIRELESKIEDILHLKNSFAPKMSAYRGVVREAYKTLRAARDRTDEILKGVEP